MTEMLAPAGRRVPPNADVVDALQRGLRRSIGRDVAIRAIERSASTYATSHVIENVDVELSDGSTLHLIFKDVGQTGLMDGARSAKPAFLRDPLREIETYRSILADATLETATCYGWVVDDVRDRHWLFLERVPGVELYQVGSLDTWRHVAAWLAHMHVHFSAAAEDLAATHGRMLRYDARFHERWAQRAVYFAHAAERSDHERRGLRHITRHYDQVIARLVEAPATIIHGEFYASNVLVVDGAGGLRVCPVDWETTAVGPGVVDLAALVAGPWSDHDRSELVASYRGALLAGGAPAAGIHDLQGLLDCARLHLALQWLGWSLDWTPPADHAQDWLAEALALGERLDL